MNFTQSLERAMVIGLLAVVGVVPAAEAEIWLSGAGASAPFPIYAQWLKTFSAATKGVRIDYDPGGSGAGVAELIDEDVDFAASDAAMTDAQIEKVEQGVVVLPMLAAEIVLVYNLPGVDALCLPRAVYPAIFSGAITKWNDPKIAEANPDVQLPDQEIAVVVRSDASGTSDALSAHLSVIDEEFKEKVGQAMTPKWPGTSMFVTAKTSADMANQVEQIAGSIGYLSRGYALLRKLPVATLENKAGQYIHPGSASAEAFLSAIEFPEGKLPGDKIPDLRARVPDPEGDAAYPIITLTWMLFYAEQDDAKADVLRRLIEYCIGESAQGLAPPLGYIPLPEPIIEKVRQAIRFIR